MRASVLLVDDDADMLAALEGTLMDADFTVEACGSGRAALEALSRTDYDVVVTDLRMPGIDGVHLCNKIVGNHPGIPVILVTAYGDLDAALAAMRAGAFDFMTKPFSDAELLLALERALRYRGLAPEVRHLPQSVAASPEPRGQLLGQSPAHEQLVRSVESAAQVDHPVLLHGETGSGRELCARTIHARSARANAPFVPVACAGATESDLTSMLFGNGTPEDEGLVRVAAGGTLFLRDVGALPLDLQVALLGVLRDSAVASGSSGGTVRVIAATDLDLRPVVQRGQMHPEFRERLGKLVIPVPPLRQRGDDVLLLARHFLGRSGHGSLTITDAAEKRLRTYPWPGNVRELKNCMESAAVIAQDGAIEPHTLPARVQVHAPGRSRTPEVGSLTLEAVERAHIENVMQATAGNKARAASVLGIDRTTLYRKLKHYEPDS